VGGGVGVVAASDYAIAVEKASVKLSELAVGIGPFVVGPVIVHKIGLGAYGAMSLDADWRDAAWAERHGLYAQVVADANALDVAVAARAQQLAASNPDAVRAVKRVLWEGTEEWEVLLEERAAMSGSLVLSEFTREAIRKFKKG
jgi:methylglutaconyl-CoA hydratase